MLPITSGHKTSYIFNIFLTGKCKGLLFPQIEKMHLCLEKYNSTQCTLSLTALKMYLYASISCYEGADCQIYRCALKREKHHYITYLHTVAE